jgi:hypothetical protein
MPLLSDHRNNNKYTCASTINKVFTVISIVRTWKVGLTNHKRLVGNDWGLTPSPDLLTPNPVVFFFLSPGETPVFISTLPADVPRMCSLIQQKSRALDTTLLPLP